jgi:predicted dehydrogenase
MRVGIIGCGGIAPLHVKVYKKLKDVEIVGLCDIRIERARRLANKFQIENTYDDYWDMFEKGLDYVDICTPVSTHAKIVSEAAECVPAILVEKPMALNLPECDKIIRAIEKSGSKLCIGQNQIFSPVVQKAKVMVDSGDFKLNSFKTTLNASFENLKAYNLVPQWNVEPEQRGIIWEVCCHHAYLQLHFLPDIEEVYAIGRKLKYPVYDDFAVFLRTKNDRFGIIELSWIQKETEVVYELKDTVGRRIEIQWEFDDMLEYAQDPPFTLGLVAKNFLVDEKRLLQRWVRFSSCYFRKRKLLPTANLIVSFIEAIRKDLPAPVSPEYGRKTIGLLEAIETSLMERRAVRLE